MSWTQVTEEELKAKEYEAVHAPLTDEPPTNLAELLKPNPNTASERAKRKPSVFCVKC